METTFKFLKFTRLREIDFLNLSVQFNTSKSLGFTDKYDFVHLSDLLKLYREPITIEDDISYRRVRVKTNNGGIEQRDTEIGKNIGTKKQFVARPGLFIISKIDARNGSLGIVPDELDGAIVTNDFPLYSIEKSMVNPKYITYVVTSKRFVQNVQGFSNGTTNRQRVDLNQFLSQKIPLPSLSVQNQLVADYEDNISRAQTYEEQAKNLEIEIQNYLNEKLGIQKIDKKEVKGNGLLKFVRLKEVEAWGVDKNIVQKSKLSSNYEVKKASSFIISSQYGSSEKATLNSTDIPELRMNNVVDGELDISDLKYLPSTKMNISKYKLNYGDLLLNRTNSKELVGKTAVFDLDGVFFFASYLIRLIIDTKLANVYYINYLFNSKIIRTQIDAMSRQVLGQANINVNEINSLLFPIPPLDVQEEIVNHISEMKSEVKQLKIKAVELRQQALEEFENEIFE